MIHEHKEMIMSEEIKIQSRYVKSSNATSRFLEAEEKIFE